MDPDTIASLRSTYDGIKDAYKKLGEEIHRALDELCRDIGVNTHTIEHRIKEFDSFKDKAERKKYNEPFEQTEDLCGLRITCYFHSELARISEKIHKEFVIHESVDKTDLLESNQFGYRSLHFIVTLRRSWLKAPAYRGLGDLRAEIQVRTLLAHVGQPSATS